MPRRLAVLGDFVPFGVGQALGIRGGGNSLDNTLRVARLVPTEWVLLDIRVQAAERGLRARAGAHVRRGRHPAGHGESELHHPVLEGRGARNRRAPARDEDLMSVPIRPGMTVPLPGTCTPIARSWPSWPTSATPTSGRPRSDGADGFTPLALAAAWEPRLRLGTAIIPAYTRSPALHGPVRGLDGRRRAGTVRHRHRLVEQRDRRAVERRAVRRAVQEGPRRRAVPAGRAVGREGRQVVRHLRDQRLQARRPPRGAAGDPGGRAARGHAAAGRREADGAIINWLAPTTWPRSPRS